MCTYTYTIICRCAAKTSRREHVVHAAGRRGITRRDAPCDCSGKDKGGPSKGGFLNNV